MTALRRRMDQDMVLRGMAEKTREAYLAAVVGLVRFYRRSPDQISDAEVQTYLLYLIQERKRAWSTCNIAVHGLRFFYHVTLKRDRSTFSIPAPRQPGSRTSSAPMMCGGSWRRRPISSTTPCWRRRTRRGYASTSWSISG
jgi:hypothetical protein